VLDQSTDRGALVPRLRWVRAAGPGRFATPSFYSMQSTQRSRKRLDAVLVCDLYFPFRAQAYAGYPVVPCGFRGLMSSPRSPWRSEMVETMVSSASEAPGFAPAPPSPNGS
jgi:hypothetical protein